MIKEIDFDLFKKGHDIVEQILADNDEGKDVDLYNILSSSSEEFKTKREKRMFYSHINTLFLNVMLNRLTEYGIGGEKISQEARLINCELIKKIDNYEENC